METKVIITGELFCPINRNEKLIQDNLIRQVVFGEFFTLY